MTSRKRENFILYILLLSKLLILRNFVNHYAYAYGFELLVVVTVLVSSTVRTDNVPLENN
jgi:hypothetical protein